MSGGLELDDHLPSGGDADDFLARTVAPALREHRPDVSEQLLEILAELLDNAVTHGDSSAGTRFSLRVGAASVVATIADRGIGIRAHLARGGLATDSDSEAIAAAIREGTTGAYEPRGWRGGIVEGRHPALEDAERGQPLQGALHRHPRVVGDLAGAGLADGPAVRTRKAPSPGGSSLDSASSAASTNLRGGRAEQAD